jgi:hypothetical protein
MSDGSCRDIRVQCEAFTQPTKALPVPWCGETGTENGLDLSGHRQRKNKVLLSQKKCIKTAFVE